MCSSDKLAARSMMVKMQPQSKTLGMVARETAPDVAESLYEPQSWLTYQGLPYPSPSSRFISLTASRGAWAPPQLGDHLWCRGSNLLGP